MNATNRVKCEPKTSGMRELSLAECGKVNGGACVTTRQRVRVGRYYVTRYVTTCVTRK